MKKINTEKRKDFTSLPVKGEINEILEKEAERGLPEGRKGEYFFHFSIIKTFLNRFGLKDNFFDTELNDFEDISEAVENSKEIILELESKILSLKEYSEDDILLFNKVYEYLSEEEIPEKTDLIFVFGAKTPLRVEKAVELYNKGVSDKIVFSGRGPNYRETGISEAEKYRRIAVGSGVTEDSIVIEESSITIPDNVRSTLNLLDYNGVDFSSIVLVNSPYAQRRGYSHFKKYLPDSVKVYRVNCSTGENYQKDDWYKNPEGVKVVVSEFFKGKIATLLDTA